MNKIYYRPVYDRKKKLNKDGKALLQVEARLQGRRYYFSTRIYLTPRQWNAKAGAVCHHPNAALLNRRLQEFVAALEQTELELWTRRRAVSLSLLREAWNLGRRAGGSFLHFYREEAVRLAVRESTRRNHLSTLKLLEAHAPRLEFADLTPAFVAAFHQYLQGLKYRPNTIAKHMKHLKRYANAAMARGYLDRQQQPFCAYRICTTEGCRTYLTPDELQLLEQLPLDGYGSKWREVRDAFLFCCYTGLRYSDFVHLCPACFRGSRQERWLVYTSAKTGTEVRLPLYLLFGGKAVALLEQYADNLPRFFGLKDNSNVNKRLEALRKLAGIEKRISFHMARHTHATLLLYIGAHITTVQKLLGHRSVKTTQIYARVMDMTLVRDLERLHF